MKTSGVPLCRFIQVPASLSLTRSAPRTRTAAAMPSIHGVAGRAPGAAEPCER